MARLTRVLDIFGLVPDYSVLRFTAKKANFYSGLINISFEIE